MKTSHKGCGFRCHKWFFYDQEIRGHTKREAILEFVLKYMWLGLIRNHQTTLEWKFIRNNQKVWRHMTTEALNKHSIKPNNLERNNITTLRLNVWVKEANTIVILQKWKPCPSRIKRNWPLLWQLRSKTTTMKKVFKRRQAWTLVTKLYILTLHWSTC